MKKYILVLFLLSNAVFAQKSDMIIRISEIEIEPTNLAAYLSILNEESSASVRLEPGVISIFPMLQKEHPNQVRILEIYIDRPAYEAHLKTPHFLKYKTETVKMVKSLKLVDMQATDSAAMEEMFKKVKK